MLGLFCNGKKANHLYTATDSGFESAISLPVFSLLCCTVIMSCMLHGLRKQYPMSSLLILPCKLPKTF